MEKQHTFLAFDIGASSGRAMLGTFTGDAFSLTEISRFPNEILEIDGKCYWDIHSIFNSIKAALAICARENIRLDSIGIDTWGVDFVYLDEDGTITGLPRAYRDAYTTGMPEEFFQQVPKNDVFGLTGIQTLPFNTLFQLYAAGREKDSPLKNAREILFMPDVLAYLLTGKRVCEYTIASTSQFINAGTRGVESSLLETAGAPPSIMGALVMPGTRVGELSDVVARETGIGKVPVISVAGHDTASAVVAVPASNHRFAYLSSGTWSLLGIEVEEPILTERAYELNFTNEGGIEGTIRFLKNITGMWILEQCRKEWKQAGKHYSYQDITGMVLSADPFRCMINPDAPLFSNPSSMVQAISDYCIATKQTPPENDAQTVRAIFESLALRYNQVMEMLCELAPFIIDTLHIIGGGSKNDLLNRFTAGATQRQVIAGPAEATAIGNLMVQAKTMGLVKDRWEIRKLITRSIATETYVPEAPELWNDARAAFRSMTESMEE